MSKLHLVFGGRVADPRGLDFEDLSSIDVVGVTVDDAEMKYVVVHLHRLLEPGIIAGGAQ